MSIIYETLNDKIVPFLVFDKYESEEKVTKIYDELNKEYPNRFILNTTERRN